MYVAKCGPWLQRQEHSNVFNVQKRLILSYFELNYLNKKKIKIKCIWPGVDIRLQRRGRAGAADGGRARRGRGPGRGAAARRRGGGRRGLPLRRAARLRRRVRVGRLPGAHEVKTTIRIRYMGYFLLDIFF